MRLAEPLLPLRNPCHCGSGKRYKNCHYDSDPSVVPEVVFRRERSKPGTIAGMIEGLERELAARGEVVKPTGGVNA